MNIIKWAVNRLSKKATTPASGSLGDIAFMVDADLPKIYTSAGWTSIDTGTGDVVGPASSTDNALARFSGTTGLLLKDSTAILSDAGALQLASLTATGAIQAGAANSHSWTGRSSVLSPADGVIELLDNAGTSFGRLQFGGTTASFPSLKRNSTALAVRLADDSADAPISASTATFSSTVVGTQFGTSTTNAIIPAGLTAARTLTFLDEAQSIQPWTFVAKLAADFTVTNGTLNDVTGFSFTGTNGETYRVEVTGASSADNTTGDISVALATTGTWGTGQSWTEGVAFNGTAVLTSTAPTAFASTTLSTASPGLNINNGDGVVRPFKLIYYFTMTGTGTVKLQMGQTALAAGRNSTLKAQTLMSVRRIG